MQINIVQLPIPDCFCPSHDGLDSARVYRVALVRGQSPGERTSSCLSGKHLPTVVLRASVSGMPMHFTPCRPLGMSTAVAILLVTAPILLAEVNLGHPLLDFGQPSVLRSALFAALAPYASTPRTRACETTLMPSAFVDEFNAALSEAFDTRTTDLPSTPSSSFDTWKSSPLSSQPTIELTASVITVATVWFIPL